MCTRMLYRLGGQRRSKQPAKDQIRQYVQHKSPKNMTNQPPYYSHGTCKLTSN